MAFRTSYVALNVFMSVKKKSEVKIIQIFKVINVFINCFCKIFKANKNKLIVVGYLYLKIYNVFFLKTKIHNWFQLHESFLNRHIVQEDLFSITWNRSWSAPIYYIKLKANFINLSLISHVKHIFFNWMLYWCLW